MSDNPTERSGKDYDLIAAAKELFEQGFGVTQSRSELREMGFKFSNVTLSNLFTGFRNPTHTFIYEVPSYEVPNPEVFNVSSIPLPDNYRFLVSVSVTDEVTGESYSGIHAIDVDSLETIGEMELNFQNFLEESYYQGRATVNFVHLIEAYQKV